MKQFDICDAATQLSELVELAGKGESFIIARAGFHWRSWFLLAMG